MIGKSKDPSVCGELTRLFDNAVRLYQSDQIAAATRLFAISANRRIDAMSRLFHETGCDVPDIGTGAAPSTGSGGSPSPGGGSPSGGGSTPTDMAELAQVPNLLSEALVAAAKGDLAEFAAKKQALEGFDMPKDLMEKLHQSLEDVAGDADHPGEVRDAARELMALFKPLAT